MHRARPSRLLCRCDTGLCEVTRLHGGPSCFAPISLLYHNSLHTHELQKFSKASTECQMPQRHFQALQLYPAAPSSPFSSDGSFQIELPGADSPPPCLHRQPSPTHTSALCLLTAPRPGGKPSRPHAATLRIIKCPFLVGPLCLTDTF